MGEPPSATALSIDVRHDRVCRAQIDADQITRSHRRAHLPVFSRMFSSSFQRFVAVARYTPDLEGAEFGDASLDAAPAQPFPAGHPV